ncbi:MAG: flagellar hook-associated protein FlgK [Pirellulales bacterium]|nr:flagellar hook-associated protein FlgK [Pirellulales bacterium]
MSLFSSIQLAGSTLRAQQIGLQVTGQNIANANTPGYIREEVVFTPGPTQRLGNLLLGLGSRVQAIIQKSDKFLDERLRAANSEQAGTNVEKETYLQLEAFYGELGSTDLSTSLNNFFNTISEVLNQPESDAARNLVALKGKTLTGDINRLARRVGDLRSDLNDRVAQNVDDVNRLLASIRTLNIQISNSEGGDVSASDAVGLRDQRNQALTELSKLIDVQVEEQESGAVSVFAGGEFLVIDGLARSLTTKASSEDGLGVFDVRIAETDSPLNISSGELYGLIHSRDEVLANFLETLDNFSGALAFEFNKVFSSGQGLTGYSTLTSHESVDSVTAALDATGLDFTPVNGSFALQVHNKRTGLTQTTEIRVDLNGLESDTSLADLAAQIDAINGVSATLTPERKLVIASDSTDQEFTFGQDTSGALAALGINTFFVGNDASSLGINSIISADPSKFAASLGGLGEDTKNAVALAGFLDRPLESQAGTTLSDLYDRMTADLTQNSTIAQSAAEGALVFKENLQGQSLAISGVNLDEEAINMLRYQRVYQASAKFIQTLDELLQLLVTL